jgi:demethylmenaquinone methyltransferase/2-methoxy-6-polyprenyl-1,4-benzoquinol methylase
MDAHRQKVQGIFSRIAGKYDRMNTILSFNLDKSWRKRTLQIAAPTAAERWLDVCCGTGKLTLDIRRSLDVAGEVTGLDFTAAMLTVAKQAEKQEKLSTPINWLEADAMEMPFANATFDGVTIGFGLRNLPDLDQGLREMLRVLKPGGRLVCLELSHPVWPIYRQGHQLFVNYAVPFIGNLSRRGERNYHWLTESLNRFPGAVELGERMKNVGFGDVRFFRLSGGIAAIHSGFRN